MSIFKEIFNIFEKRDNNQVVQKQYSPFSNGSLFFGKYDFSENPMSLSAVYAATELISNSLAQLPIYVKKKGEIQEEHYIHDLFYKNRLSKYILLKQLVVDMLLYGNAYVYIRRGSDGRPIELVYLPKFSVSIQYPIPNGDLYYIVTNVKDIPNKVLDKDILHFYKNSRDGVQGIGILSYGNKALKLSEYQNNSATDFYDSGCSISGILKFNEQVLDVDKDEIRKNWQQVHGANSSGLAIMDYNCDFLPVQQTPKDSQLIESRQFSITEIARYFGINPCLLQDLTHISYSTLEAAQMEFVQHTLMQYVTLFQDEMTRKLCDGYEIIDLDETYLLVSDKQSQANYIKTLVDTGVISRNEGRYMLGLAPIDGLDDIVIPFTKIEDNKLNNVDKSENNKEIEEDKDK